MTTFNLGKSLRLKKPTVGTSQSVFEFWNWSFSFSGPVNKESGMIINLVKAEEIIKRLEDQWQDADPSRVWTEREKIFDEVRSYLKKYPELQDVKLQSVTFGSQNGRQVWILTHLTSQVNFSSFAHYTSGKDKFYIPFKWSWQVEREVNIQEFAEIMFPAVEGFQWTTDTIEKFLKQRQALSLEFEMPEGVERFVRG